MHSEPQIQERPAQPYLAIRREVTDGVPAAVDTAFPELFGWLGERGIGLSGAPFIRMLEVDHDGEPLELEVGVPVPEAVRGDGPVRAGSLPAGRWLTLLHTGPYRSETEPDLLGAHARLQRWCIENGVGDTRGATDRGWALPGSVDHFIVGPDSEPDFAKWQTELAYLTAEEAHTVSRHRTGTRDEWLTARRDLLEKEKELTRRSDELAKERLELPWVPVEKEYRFETPEGTKTLAELFDGRSQLLVYHFMFSEKIDGGGCPSCSLSADHFDGPAVHLGQRDVSFVSISRAPLERLEAYKERMGWNFTWVSSLGSDFNYDFDVSFTEAEQAGSGQYNFGPIEQPFEELPGMSAFVLEDGVVYHTYSAFSRGGDVLMGLYQLLDRAPKGRNEDGYEHHPMEWVRRHDEYETTGAAS